MNKAPIDKAVDAAGGLSELAKKLGVDPQVIVNWRKRGIPVAQVPAVERESGVPRHELRPDMPELFPPPASPAEERSAA